MSNGTSSQHPRKFANRYRIEHKIGEGAHASTWRGWDERLERSVAIKTLHPRLANDAVFVQRFRAEARIAASIRQANVVDVYDFGQEDGTLYIVMQFIDGEDLKQLIQRTAPLSIRDTRRIIGNVLDGLQAIHAAGIVHRDIKPQNVLIGKDGVARVTDFGVAEVDVTSGLTGEGLTIGTVEYMAPEQAQGLPLSAGADLYATGVMLYEMLTGTLPLQGSNARETMLQHINGGLTPPGERLPHAGITPAIDAVVAQILAKEPARRFGSARAMKQALGQVLVPATPQQPAHPVQATTVMPSAPVQPSVYQPAPPQIQADEGSGLNGAFEGLIMLLLIGAMGIAVWGAFQLLDSDRFDFNLPSFGSDQQETPAPTATTPPQDTQPIAPDNGGGEDVTAPPVEQVPTETPLPPEQEPEPTAPPTESTEPPPIEPMDPDADTEIPEIDPSGYDGEYSTA